MKEAMLKRVSLTVLLIIQALGGGAISLAHARDQVIEPPHFEASHSARCAILHDELRCALCHYASARVVTQTAFTFTASATDLRIAPAQPAPYVATAVHRTTPARAPPVLS
jgi:hypothetical protein